MEENNVFLEIPHTCSFAWDSETKGQLRCQCGRLWRWNRTTKMLEEQQPDQTWKVVAKAPWAEKEVPNA